MSHSDASAVSAEATVMGRKGGRARVPKGLTVIAKWSAMSTLT